VLLSYVEAVLAGAGITPLIADTNMSVLEGSLGILPRRVLVAETDWRSARHALEAAGLAHVLTAEPGAAALPLDDLQSWRWPSRKWT